MSRINGLTLFELMLSLSIVAVTATLAVPSFAELRRDVVRSATVNDFLHALYLARSEAIGRMEVVSVCRSEDMRTCGSGGADWASGWLVFANLDRDQPPQVDPGEPVLRTYAGWQAGRITANREGFSFRPVQQAGVNGTVLFCDQGGPRTARAIVVSQTGRPRVTRQDANGRPLECP